MRVPDEMLNCVAFVGEVTHRDSARVYGDPRATGFFVSVPCESPELSEMAMTYFVTAKHVALDLKEQEICFLINRRGGGGMTVESVDGHWWFHPDDKTADVAVTQVRLPSYADVIAISLEHFALPERLNKFHIGIGDEVFAVGLFTPAAGVARNAPIVRHGNISMMPGEQIETDLGYADVYLVESRSIGGISGSPVFSRHTIAKKIQRADDTADVAFSNGPGETLLGLMHGHWDINESEMNKPYFTHDRKHGVNYGVGIVVPASKIYEALYSDGLREMRAVQEKNLVRRSVPGTDIAEPRRKEDGAAFTQNDFESALKKASRKTERK